MMTRWVSFGPALCSLAFGLCGCAGQSARIEPEFIPMPGAEQLNLPFSAAVRAGDTIYLAGQIGNVPGSMAVAPGGIKAQTRQALENIKSLVEGAGSSMDRVVKCTVFLADMGEWPAMNEVYATYFPNKPARSAIAVSGLAAGARVEIECIALAEK